jgi:hypothetical protein
MQTPIKQYTLFLLIVALVACVPIPLQSVVLEATETATALTLLSPEITAELLPDLIIKLMYIEMEGRNGTCVSAYTPYGTRVIIENIGSFDSGSFIVSMNEDFKEVENGLLAGQSIEFHFAGTTPNGRYDAIADATDLIGESQEDNNYLTYFAPTPTPPLLCTATPTKTP